MSVVKVEAGVVIQTWHDVVDVAELAAKYGLFGDEYEDGDYPPDTILVSKGVFTEPPRDLALENRKERNHRLISEVDPIASNVLRWGSISTEQQDAWSVYRQALLDVTQQEGFPNDVVWPTKPS